MVRGVNKTVIEVNNTGSKVFDRIVFYVNPSCSSLSPKHLKRAMQNFSFQFEEKTAMYKTVRQRRILRRRIIIAALVMVFIVATAITLIVLL